MGRKAKLVWNTIALVLVASFIVGVFGGIGGYGLLIWGMLAIVVAIVLGLILGVSAIVYFERTKRTKGIFIGILILLVSIPLIFLGTCALSVGGNFVRRLFVK